MATFLSCCICTAYAQQEVSTSMSYHADTHMADNLFYDGVREMIQGKGSAAEDLFLQFLKIKPEEPAAYYELSKINFDLNKSEKSEEYIKKAIELDSNNKWYMEQYAAILVAKNNFSAAAALLELIANKETHNKDYFFNAALLYQRAGKNAEALKDLNKILAYSADEDALVRKQQIFAKMNKSDSSAAMMEQLIKLEPQDARYYTLLAEMYDNNDQHAKAMQVYEKALQHIPDDAGLQLSLAEHYRKTGDSVQFINYFKKTITNRQMDVQTQLDMLYSYIRTLPAAEKDTQGMQMILQIVEQHPADAKVYEAYGDILVLNKQISKAIEQYKRSVTIDPSKLRVWVQILRGYAEKRTDADSLIIYAQKALRLFPNQAEVHFLYGIGLMNKKNYPDAIKAVNRAIDMQPEDDTAIVAGMYSILGDIYNTTQQYDLSDSVLDHALRLQPNDAGALNNYAYYLSVRGVRLNDAEAMSKRSLQIQPGAATFLDTYGWILYKQKKYDKAREFIEKAIASDANADGAVWEHLGDIWYKLGDVNKAVENWQKAKQKNTDDPFIDKKISDKKLYE